MSGPNVMRRIGLYWLPWLSYCALIFYVSHQSDPMRGIELPVDDKVIHFLEFFLLFFLTIRAFSHSATSFVSTHALPLSIAFALLYAASDEVHQWFIPERNVSIFDFVADGVGILIGALIYHTHITKTKEAQT